MKIILILAFLALAACWPSTFNTTDFCLSFANETNFTAAQIQDCLKCVQSNNTIDVTMTHEFSYNGNPSPNLLCDAFFQGIYPNTTVSAECEPYVADLQGYFSANMTSDQLLKTIDDRLNKHLGLIIMNYATWRLAELAKDSYMFGKQGALLFRFVTGAGDIDNQPSEVEPWQVNPPKRFLGF